MDKVWMVLNKKGAQSAVSLQSFYKKAASSSLGRSNFYSNFVIYLVYL